MLQRAPQFPEGLKPLGVSREVYVFRFLAVQRRAGISIGRCGCLAPGDRLEGNMIYRGGSNSGNQCTSVQRGLDPTTGDEEYVLVPNGNVVSLAP